MSALDAGEAVVTFPDGLPGFETNREFLILAREDAEPFVIVQGLGPNAPSFAAINPLRVVGGYRAVLSGEDKARLLSDDTSELVWLAIVTAGAGDTPTVNLRAPLVINPRSLRGIQLMPAESDYSFEHPLQAA